MGSRAKTASDGGPGSPRPEGATAVTRNSYCQPCRRSPTVHFFSVGGPCTSVLPDGAGDAQTGPAWPYSSRILLPRREAWSSPGGGRRAGSQGPCAVLPLPCRAAWGRRPQRSAPPCFRAVVPPRLKGACQRRSPICPLFRDTEAEPQGARPAGHSEPLCPAGLGMGLSEFILGPESSFSESTQ